MKFSKLIFIIVVLILVLVLSAIVLGDADCKCECYMKCPQVLSNKDNELIDITIKEEIISWVHTASGGDSVFQRFHTFLQKNGGEFTPLPESEYAIDGGSITGITTFKDITKNKYKQINLQLQLAKDSSKITGKVILEQNINACENLHISSLAHSWDGELGSNWKNDCSCSCKTENQIPNILEPEQKTTDSDKHDDG